ncbi:GNAT family N-acetyltransferase [Marinomonas sp. 2405UD66-6]|uniref:GNAT family N-acetyltransferase n=1 Tax=Marinomonas sp. 2405UD66-6 TaxID=3391834 RepID=UPI0039C95FF4
MRFKHVQDDETNGMFIANSDTGARVAYLIWDFPEDNENVIEICDLMIYSEEDRGKGIGSALINLLLEHARKLKVDEVMGITQADDKLAHAFYEKHGFSFPEPHRFTLTVERS